MYLNFLKQYCMTLYTEIYLYNYLIIDGVNLLDKNINRGNEFNLNGQKTVELIMQCKWYYVM